ncbi:hypothetical protein QS468_27310 [Bacillus subtilis]|nr:hypothetical protein [Pseudomonas sp. A29(2023)]MDL5596454.1 hypothetical protein [Bacillus subtilis]
MMSFALVTEGDTDQAVLEEIIQTIYLEKTGDEVEIRVVQPLYDETTMSRSEVFGGWEMLLDFCSNSERILEALSTNDYLVIQIDTDICEHERIKIPLTSNSAPKSSMQLIDEMRAFLESSIPLEVYNTYRENIIFAIAVHSTECWLLPLHANREGDKSQIVNCENRLYRALATQSRKYIKDARNYSEYAKGFRKIKNINMAKTHNESLRLFVDSLPQPPA